MKNVYSAYDYTTRIIEYIKNHRDDEVIYIDMNDLNEYWENHEGTFEIEHVG